MRPQDIEMFERYYQAPDRQRRHRREGYVYFVQRGTDGPIKIGWSVNPRKRLSSLRSASAESLTLLKVEWTSRKRERQLHELLAEHRITGEWFHPAPEVLRAAGIRPTE